MGEFRSLLDLRKLASKPFGSLDAKPPLKVTIQREGAHRHKDQYCQAFLWYRSTEEAVAVAQVLDRTTIPGWPRRLHAELARTCPRWLQAWCNSFLSAGVFASACFGTYNIRDGGIQVLEMISYWRIARGQFVHPSCLFMSCWLRHRQQEQQQQHGGKTSRCGSHAMEEGKDMESERRPATEPWALVKTRAHQLLCL